MRLELSGWSIDVPPGWTTVIGEGQESLRLFFEAVVHNEENHQTVASSGIELSVQHIRAQPQTIESYADAEMRRHVRQGRPDVSSRRMGGRDVRSFRWGNGVQEIQTVFVEIPGEPSLALLRFDIIATLHANEIVERGRVAATRILDSLTWR